MLHIYVVQRLTPRSGTVAAAPNHHHVIIRHRLLHHLHENSKSCIVLGCTADCDTSPDYDRHRQSLHFTTQILDKNSLQELEQKGLNSFKTLAALT